MKKKDYEEILNSVKSVLETEKNMGIDEEKL